MPDRILKESISKSETINNLTPEQEVFFYRLLVHCDDFGRFEAHPRLLRSALYPLRSDDEIPLEYVISWRNVLADQGLIRIYESEGKEYLEVVTWRKYQRVRADKSKFPEPVNIIYPLPASADNSENPQTSADKCPQAPADDNNGGHPQANAPVIRNAISDIRYSNNDTTSEKGGKEVSDAAVSLAGKLKNLVLRNNPTAKTPKDLAKWAIEFDRMLRIDHRPREDIEAVIQFSQDDQFWSSNVISASALREKYDRLYLKMKNGGNTKNAINRTSPQGLPGNRPGGAFRDIE